jgi:hypothetical protein
LAASFLNQNSAVLEEDPRDMLAKITARIALPSADDNVNMEKTVERLSDADQVLIRSMKESIIL